MANITPKSNGTYLVRISCGSDAAGKPIIKSRVFKPSKPKLTYQKLNRELDIFIKQFEEEIELFGVQKRPDRMRFAEFTEEYLRIKKPQLSPPKDRAETEMKVTSLRQRLSAIPRSCAQF